MKLLSASFLIARIRGMEIRIHLSALLSVPAAYYLFQPADVRGFVITGFWVAGFLLFIILHELGHALAAMLFQVEVKSVAVWLLGGFTQLSRRAESPLHDFFISAAGPLANMLLSFLFVALYAAFLAQTAYANTLEAVLWGQEFSNLFFSFALVNVILAAFNLLPIYPLDGGSMLRSLLEILFGKSRADWIALLIGIPVLIALFLFSLFIQDYLLAFFCLLIALALGTLNKSWRRLLNLAVNYAFKRGGYYYLQGDYERAAQYFTAQIEKNPSQPGHYLARAGCLLMMRQTLRAQLDVERALGFAPNHPLALQMRGELYMLAKDYPNAEKIFNRVVELNPGWGVPYFDLGSLHLEKKEYVAALIYFDKALALLPSHALFYLIRSIAHFRLGNLHLAHRDQETALSISEQDALVMAELNLTAYEDQLDWAEDYYSRVLAQSPRLAFAWQGRADAYLINNEHAKAVMDYTQAISLNPKEARLYIGRGKSHLALNQLPQAKADFEAAYQLADKIHIKRQAEDLLKTM